MLEIKRHKANRSKCQEVSRLIHILSYFCMIVVNYITYKLDHILTYCICKYEVNTQIQVTQILESRVVSLLMRPQQVFAQNTMHLLLHMTSFELFDGPCPANSHCKTGQGQEASLPAASSTATVELNQDCSI